MKKAISLLLIISTLVGCCAGLFACKPKNPDEEYNGVVTLQNKEKVVLDFGDSANITANKLAVSTQYKVGNETQSAEWTLRGGADRSNNKITLNLKETYLSDYKEISFWMNNTSDEDINFVFYFVTADGTTHRAETSFTDPHSATMVTTIRNLVAHPGWHEYKIPFTETSAYMDKKYTYNKDTGKKDEKLNKSEITSIIIDASNTSIHTSTVKFYISSIYANSQKTGTIQGYAFDKLTNAVAFYEQSHAYLYNQNRYILDASEKAVLKADNDTAYVPIAVLAQHRGATDISATKEKVTFKYNNTSYEYTLGQVLSYTGAESGFNPGVALSSKASSVGEYLTVPMEIAAEVFGYELFYDQMGLIIFSDIPNIYADENDPDYSGGEKHLNQLYNIIEVIAFKNYTGEELIADMNELFPDDQHTRLIMTQQHFDKLKKLVQTDPTYASWFNRYEARYAKGTAAYGSKLPYFELSDGYRLLQMSRDVMADLIAYSFLYKMTDNEDYAKKVQKIMLACTRFIDNDLTNKKSWHPEHYLDTGEIMFGYGIAYDWCYDYLSKDRSDLKTIENGIWEYGYGAAMGFGELYEWWNNTDNLANYNKELADKGEQIWNKYGSADFPYRISGYRGNSAPYSFNTYKWTNNWNAVCNGGIGVMALAFANVNDEFRAASEYLLDCISFTFPAGLFEGYAPDGGYPEGPGYWSYGTTYSVNYISALTSATGSDQGYVGAPGFSESYYFINGIGSTVYGTWDYHDAHVGLPDTQLYFWFSDFTGDKNIAGIRYKMINEGKSNPAVWDLMWYDPNVYTTDLTLNLDYCYFGIDTATFRSDWTDNALFCGLHGGANAASHGQLDIGNFIVEFGGTRFFMDLGADEYNLAGYDKNGRVTYFMTPYRYWYYRMRAEGQNTLVINPVRCNTAITGSGDGAQGKNYDQKYSAVSELLRFESGKNSALAVVDMGCAYTEANANKTASGENIRGMLVTDNRSTVIIQDEITLNGNNNKVMWMGHVIQNGKVTVSEDKKSATIEYKGKTLLCEIVVPEGYTADFKFEVRAADYLPETQLNMTPGEYKRDGMQKLVAVAENVSEIKLAVVCRLLEDGPHSYTWTDIKDWKVDR